MNLTPDVKARIENHLNAVRANLAGKEESVQNEVLEGLRDHINETLARQGGPVTAESVQAVLDAMDDPASYAEESATAASGSVRISGGSGSARWFYVALAFLLVNTVGGWKLVQIERKTGSGGAGGQLSGGIEVPSVPSDDKSGIRYPDAGSVAPPKPEDKPKPETAGKPPLRSIAFLDNSNPVLQQPDQPLSWLFNGDVVDAASVGKPASPAPLKITPPVDGEFVWQTPAKLLFKPAKPWSLNQSFTAELGADFKMPDGVRYEGPKFWRFGTPVCEVVDLTQLRAAGMFVFKLDLSIPVDAESFGSKFKLFYLDSDGEKIRVDYKAQPVGDTGSLRIETPIVPAISFVCEIEPGLRTRNWADGTRERIERRLLNSRLLTLSGALFDGWNPDGKQSVSIRFNDDPAAGDLAGFFEVNPAVAFTIGRAIPNSGRVILTGDFQAGTTYEIKVKRGLTSADGSVLPYTTTRALVLTKPAGTPGGEATPPPANPKPAFDVVEFTPNPGLIVSGKQELRWTFPHPMVGREEVGRTLQEAPVRLSPDTQGSFFWVTERQLAFRPNTEWALNQYHEARLVADLSNLAGTRYTGIRFWSFNTPAMAIKSVRQIEAAGTGFRFGVEFTTEPHADSVRDKTKVFCYDESGKRMELPFTVQSNYSGSLARVFTVPNLPSPQIRFELQPGFRPAKWDQGIRERVEAAAVITSVLQVESIAATEPGERVSGIRLRFSEGVDVKSATPFVSVEPQTKFTLERESSYNNQNTLRLVGEFAAHKTYKVRVRQGLVSERGCLLVKEAETSVTIARAGATLAFGGAGGYLSPTGSMLVPVKSRNLPKCKVSVAPVMASNLVFFAKRNGTGSSYSLPVPPDDDNGNGSDGDYDEEYGYGYGRSLDELTGNVTHKDLNLPAAPNEDETTYVKLGDFTKSKGAYLVQITGKDVKDENGYTRQVRDSRLVVITDLGISAKCADSHVFVWVCSLKDAKPAAGVEVSAYSVNNQFIAKAVTNADGVVAIPCDVANKNTRPFLITAQMGEDLSYLSLEGTRLGDPSESDEPSRDYLTKGAEAFVFTDRGIFRPGEKVHAQAILRQADFSAPQPFPVVFRFMKPDGRLFKETTVMPNSFGIAEVETEMPDYLATGRYSILVGVPKAKRDLGSATFLLEEFVPPQIRVAVKTDPARVASKDPLKAEIAAEHLFGAPAAGLKATVKCIYGPVGFSPKQWAGYRFGRESINRYGETVERPFAMKTQDIEGLELDKDGKVTAEIGTDVPANAPGPIQALIQASVFEQSGRAVTATKTAVIDPYPFYIGIKPFETGWVKSGEVRKVPVVAVRPDGEVYKPEKPLAVRLSRIEWNYNYVSSPGGGYTYQCHREVKLVREDPLDLSSGSAEYSFTPDGYGNLELAVVDPESGTASSFRFYTSDYEQSWTTSDRERPDGMTLKLDKREYAIGENAKLTIQAPFSGTALLTVESDKVLFSRVILLEKNTAEVDVEVKENFAPNVHCTVSVIRPAVAEEVWKSHRAFATVPLRVTPAAHRINVALEAPQTIQPQSKLRAKVLFKDDAGQPVDGEVTLVAVDEAICMLTSFKTPNPLAWPYQLRRLGVESHDIYSELMEVFDESVLDKNSHPSGGDGDGEGEGAERLSKRLNPIKANRFKPVALWASRIQVINGAAEVEMDVPEFTGELRLMAIGCNASRLGSAQGMVKVKRPLIVQPSLPRFLAPGDECQMDVTVFNEMGKDITAKLRVTCGGPLSTTMNERDIPIAKGASASVSIPVVGGKVPGKGLCTVSCEAENVRYSDTIEIAVRPPISAEVVADSGSLAPGKSVEIGLPGNWLPETVTRNLRVSKEPSLELGRGMQYLLRYPYGCVEQTTSSAFPLLYLPDLANQTFDKSMTRDSVKHYVNSGIWRLLSMQQAGGGFSYWPGYHELHPWGTSYATHFLLEARKAGYEVPEASLDRAVKALRASVDSGTAPAAEDTYFYDNLSYACYVLAVAGEPVHSWQERMLEKKSGLSYYARLMNASALLLQGDPKRAVALLEELGLPGPSVRDQGGCFNSPNRNAALLLSAWLDIDPKRNEVYKLVQVLGKARFNGYWGTTQDSAMALMALGKFAQRTKGSVAEFKGTITFGDGATEPIDHTKERVWENIPNAKGVVKLTNDGPGMLYYSFETEGVPVDADDYYKRLCAKNSGMRIEREWLDDEGNPIDPSKVKQNDLVVGKITLNPNGRAYDNIVIEDLLPAGLEVENPNLETAQVLPWLTAKHDWCARRDIRDDRVLVFTRPVSGASTFYYLARAVTPGRFTVPPISAECMYDPEVRSITSQTEMTITK